MQHYFGKCLWDSLNACGDVLAVGLLVALLMKYVMLMCEVNSFLTSLKFSVEKCLIMQTNTPFLLTGIYVVLHINAVGKEIQNLISPACSKNRLFSVRVETLNNIPEKCECFS